MGRLLGTVGGYSFGMPSGFVRVDLEKSSRKLGIFFARFFSFLKDLQYFYSLNLKLCGGNDFKRSFSEEG